MTTPIRLYEAATESTIQGDGESEKVGKTVVTPSLPTAESAVVRWTSSRKAELAPSLRQIHHLRDTCRPCLGVYVRHTVAQKIAVASGVQERGSERRTIQSTPVDQHFDMAKLPGDIEAQSCVVVSQ